MSRKAPNPEKIPRYYSGKDVTLAIIRRYARKVAEQFQPDKIILFGSHAYGTPHVDSDVDLLVVMEAKNQRDLGLKIRLNIRAPFAMDLLVRNQETLTRRMRLGDSFLIEIVTNGKVLYENTHEGMDKESRKRPSLRRNTSGKRPVAA